MSSRIICCYYEESYKPNVKVLRYDSSKSNDNEAEAKLQAKLSRLYHTLSRAGSRPSEAFPQKWK